MKCKGINNADLEQDFEKMHVAVLSSSSEKYSKKLYADRKYENE